jgi:starch synthase
MKVLFATSEVAPLIKTGGLADVSGALPAALRQIGVDAHVLVPGYSQVTPKIEAHEVAAVFDGMPGFPPARLLSAKMANGVPLFVLDCPELYHRDGGPYQDSHGHDWKDNALRFGLLSKVAAVLGSAESPLGWKPDLVHCNDWQTALAPTYLHYAKGAAPSVISIHNLAFQGIFPPETVEQLHLPASSFNLNGIEYYGKMSFLKAGLIYADYITTVSPNYAIEIQHENLGFGLQGVLSARHKRLRGILNGIDADEWNPATDSHLPQTYSVEDLSGKVGCKEALQSRMGLTIEPGIPLLGTVSRFTEQKGLDLLLKVVPQIVELPAQLVMLGTGDALLQKTARDLSHKYPGKVGVIIGFDEGMSHLIEAGADMFIMPSRFEPCGLNQMYSQRYGTPPIVHATGGLVDSVVDCSDATLLNGTASGFKFSGMTAEKLYATIRRAVGVYHDKRKWSHFKSTSKWETLRKNCMSKNFGWTDSAEAYREVYLTVLGK